MLYPLSPNHYSEILETSFSPPNLFTWGLGIRNEKTVDEHMPLLEHGRLVVFAGAEGSGKTTWAIEMAKQNAIKGKEKGYKVGFLSLEVSPYRVVQRYAERKVLFNKLDKMYGFSEPLLTEKKEAYKKALDEFAEVGLLIIPESIEDYNKITYIEKLCASEVSPPLLFIDNLAEIDPDNASITAKGEYDKYDYIMRYLLDIAKNTSTTIVLLHHLAKPKQNERLTINSVKGNNIVITKADIVIGIDKHRIINPNWECDDFDLRGGLVADRTRAAFMGYAPRIEVRAVEVFKDRDWDERGVKGYLRLIDGDIHCDDIEGLKRLFPFTSEEKQKYDSALETYNLKKKNAAIELPDTL